MSPSEFLLARLLLILSSALGLPVDLFFSPSGTVAYFVMYFEYYVTPYLARKSVSKNEKQTYVWVTKIRFVG